MRGLQYPYNMSFFSCVCEELRIQAGKRWLRPLGNPPRGAGVEKLAREKSYLFFSLRNLFLKKPPRSFFPLYTRFPPVCKSSSSLSPIVSGSRRQFFGSNRRIVLPSDKEPFRKTRHFFERKKKLLFNPSPVAVGVFRSLISPFRLLSCTSFSFFHPRAGGLMSLGGGIIERPNKKK